MESCGVKRDFMGFWVFRGLFFVIFSFFLGVFWWMGTVELWIRCLACLGLVLEDGDAGEKNKNFDTGKGVEAGKGLILSLSFFFMGYRINIKIIYLKDSILIYGKYSHL